VPLSITKLNRHAVPGVLSEDCNRNIDSRDHKSGTFSSPNYPDNYPPDVVCQYTFQGHGRERVQISFTDFRLRHHFGYHVDSDKSVRRLLRPPPVISCSDMYDALLSPAIATTPVPYYESRMNALCKFSARSSSEEDEHLPQKW